MILFLTTIHIMGCCKCDIPESETAKFDLSSAFLEQTVWEGTLTVHHTDGEVITSNINVFFKTKSDALVQIAHESTEGGVEDNITYKANKNMLSIGSTSIFNIYGEWLVIEKSQNKLVLGKSLINEKWKFKMSLTRKY